MWPDLSREPLKKQHEMKRKKKSSCEIQYHASIDTSTRQASGPVVLKLWQGYHLVWLYIQGLSVICCLDLSNLDERLLDSSFNNALRSF